MNQQVVAQSKTNEVYKSIKDDLHQSCYPETLNKTRSCYEFRVYERYAQDLGDLLRACIQYYERDRNRIISFYQKQINDLTNKTKFDHQLKGDSQAIMNNFKVKDVVTTQDDLGHKNKIDGLQTTCNALEMILKTQINLLLDENEVLRNGKLEADAENEIFRNKLASLKLELKKTRSSDEKQKSSRLQSDDMTALVLEIAERHDQITNLRVVNRKLEERIEELEQKVKFREKIIRELRRSNCQPQNSILFKSYPEDKFMLCFGDTRKYEIERLHQTIKDLQSENGCNRLLIMKLEDELLMTRKSETRTKQVTDLKSDKLRVLRYKVRSTGMKALGTISGEIEKPNLHYNNFHTIEDELKVECDILLNLSEKINESRQNCLKTKVNHFNESLEHSKATTENR